MNRILDDGIEIMLGTTAVVVWPLINGNDEEMKERSRTRRGSPSEER